jgi:hypothetical protein
VSVDERSYEHLAQVFRKALVNTRRVEHALWILDSYRVRSIAGREVQATHLAHLIAPFFGVNPSNIVTAAGATGTLSDARAVLAYVLTVRGSGTDAIAGVLGADRQSVLGAVEEVTGRPSLMMIARLVVEPIAAEPMRVDAAHEMPSAATEGPPHSDRVR